MSWFCSAICCWRAICCCAHSSSAWIEVVDGGSGGTGCATAGVATAAAKRRRARRIWELTAVPAADGDPGAAALLATSDVEAGQLLLRRIPGGGDLERLLVVEIGRLHVVQAFVGQRPVVVGLLGLLHA